MKKLLTQISILSIVLSMISCVPNRKFAYLQKNDLGSTSLPIDSVVRTYAIDTFRYKIQANDILSIRFESLTTKDFDFLNTNQSVNTPLQAQANPLLIGELVDEQGYVFYPVVGKVQVAGLTVFEAQEKFRSIAARYLESPVVRVRLLNYRITILGEVNKEGTIVLSNNRITLLEAIGMSGGVTDLADKSSIKLIRQKGGKVEILYVNLLDENFIKSPYYFVHQNDVLVVPPLRQRPYRKYFGQNLALIVSALSLLVLTLNLTK